jgi:hypothetical protein
VIADVDNESTAFLAVDFTGNVENLASTAPFYCVGFGVTADGASLACGMPTPTGGDPSFTLIPNQ